MLLVNWPIAREMDVAPVATGTEVAKVVSKSCGANRRRNEMPNMTVRATEIKAAAAIASITMSLNDNLSTQLPQVLLEL
jgi:hypothetical protein